MPANVNITSEPVNLVAAAGLAAGATYRVQNLGVSQSTAPARAEARGRIMLAESAADTIPDKTEGYMLAGIGADADFEIDAGSPLWAWVDDGDEGRVGLTEVSD